jgi:ABC-type sugar transport system ATPase subunit
MTMDKNSTTPLLQMDGVSKHYPGVQALSDVSLTLRSGTILALVGENGAGKSTLIKVLSGAVRADAGSIVIDGTPIDISSPLAASTHGIATVYQEFSLFPSLSVAENLFFNDIATSTRPINWRDMRREAGAFLRELGVALDPSRLVSELTIAEQQMLEIGKAIRSDARVVIMDEPTAVLGGADVDTLLQLMDSLRMRGVGVIFISHRLDEIFGVADSYMVLKDGRLTASGLVSDTSPDELVSRMVGRVVTSDNTGAHDERAFGPEVLSVEGLSSEGIFDDVSFSVKEGEVVGFAGLRGAGRTEVARAIFGVDRVHSGSVKVRGRVLHLGKPHKSIAAGLGFVTEDRKSQGLLMALSVAKNTSLVRVATGKSHWLSPKRERKDAQQHVSDLRIKVPDVSTLVRTLSGGNQQKVVIAKWLDSGVRVLILDEPTRGVDVGAKDEIYRLIRGLCEGGMAVMLISSELPEVLHMSDRIFVMQRGRIKAELARNEATEERIAKHMVSEVVA